MTNNNAKSIYDSHPLKSTIGSIISQLQRERPVNLRNLSYQARYEYVRIKWVIIRLKKSLEEGNTMLFSEQVFQRMNNQLANFINIWNSYCVSPEPNYSYLRNYTDALVEISSYVLFNKTIESNTWIKLFEESENEIKKILTESTSAIEALKNEVAEKDRQLQNLSQQIANYEQHITSQKTRIDQNIENFVSKFAEAQTTRSLEFNEFKKEAVASIGKKFDEMQASHSEKIKLIDTNTEESIKNLKLKEEEARNIVGIIANTGTSGHYDRIANREYDNGCNMRKFAIIWFVVMGIVIIWAVVTSGIGTDAFNISTLVIRLSFGLVLLIPASYIAREASRHWQYEKHSRRLALEFSVLKPFIDPLPADERNKILAKKADEYFGRSMIEDSDNDKDENIFKGIKGYWLNRTFKDLLGFAERVIKSKN